MRSINKILVPTDFSINASNALDYALSLARGNGMEIHLVHSYSVPYTGSSVMIDISDVLRQKSEEEFHNLMSEIRHNDLNKDVIITWSCEYGPASEIIASKIDEVKADLVVMGTKGADSVASKLLGSVTYNTIRKSKVPVLVVPEKAVPGEIAKIVFASDLHLNGNVSAFDKLTGIASDFNSKVDILYVNKFVDGNPDINMAIDTLKMDKKLANIDHQFKVVNNSDVEDGINDFLQKSDCNVLAVMPKHHNFLERLFHRSVTRSLTMHANMPLLVLQ